MLQSRGPSHEVAQDDESRFHHGGNAYRDDCDEPFAGHLRIVVALLHVLRIHNTRANAVSPEPFATFKPAAQRCTSGEVDVIT